MNGIKLEDIMCEHPIKVSDVATVSAATHLLYRYRINGIFIVDKDDDSKLLGVFTTTDLLRLIDEVMSKGMEHFGEELRKFSSLPVGQLAAKKIISVQKSDDIAAVVKVMHEKKVHTVPVYDGDELVGVVGKHDILNIAFSTI